MIYKNKELLMQACNIMGKQFCYYSEKLYAKSMYKYLLNCGDADWYTYYKNNTPEYIDRMIRREYKQLIHSLNEFKNLGREFSVTCIRDESSSSR